MEALPYPDASFDLVTGFNSFFFANDFVAALREAGRVGKPGAPIVIQVWGAHERCDLEAMKAIARPFTRPRPVKARRALEELATLAGLTPETAFDTTWAYDFPDEETLTRALLAPGGLALLAGQEHEDTLKAAIIEGLTPYRREDGTYRLSNEYHYLIARA
jgi:SAM-dependent methyltransferase